MESALKVTLPPDLLSLWEWTAGLHLFEDVKYGQWGLHLWGPTDTWRKQPEEMGYWPPDVRRPGDLLVGRFLGDADRLLLRCDKTMPDFGHAVIALTMEQRSEWVQCGDSLVAFLIRYVGSAGEKFWEPQRRE